MFPKSLLGLRAFLIGVLAGVLLLAGDKVMMIVYHHIPRIWSMDLTGYCFVLLAGVLAVLIAKISDERAWLRGLYGGIGFDIPLYLSQLLNTSTHFSSWRWYIGWRMLWIYISLLSVLPLLSLWTQGIAFWSVRRRSAAFVAALGSLFLVVLVWVAGFFLAQAHARGIAVEQNLQKALPIDLSMPDMKFTERDGTPIPQSELDGHITVIDFWGTWCGACIQEFPSLEALQKSYSSGSDVKFILADPLIAGDTREKIDQFVQRKSIKMHVALVSDDSYFALSQKLHNDGLPLLILIDRHGKIRYRKFGFDEANPSLLGVRQQVDALRAEP